MYLFVLFLIIIVTSLYLNGEFLENFFWPRGSKFNVYNQINLIEFLTQQKTREKNYDHPPVEFKEFGRSIYGEIIDGNSAKLYYSCPVIGHIENEFVLTMDVTTVSDAVNKFGTTTDCLEREGDRCRIVVESGLDYLLKNLNKDGFKFDGSNFHVDYNYLAHHSGPVSKQIAEEILTILQSNGKDSYENRVVAATNFVQFIPYGQPEFDKGKDVYFGIAIPYESIILSFSDCDSKSLLLASILIHLIDYRNIIFIGCITGGPHMILGIAGLSFEGYKYTYGDKVYLLVETTVPHDIENHEHGNIEITRVYPIKNQA
jgi:hypothetical protein